MNTHVDFETAKSLKEKGFDLPMEQNGRVYCEGTGQIASIISSDQISNWNDKCYIEICSAPTISEVVMWLYEKHGIWMWVDSQMNVKSDWRTLIPNSFSFGYSIRPANEKDYLEKYNKPIIVGTAYSSPTEAYQEAINYSLKNLIK